MQIQDHNGLELGVGDSVLYFEPFLKFLSEGRVVDPEDPRTHSIGHGIPEDTIFSQPCENFVHLADSVAEYVAVKPQLCWKVVDADDFTPMPVNDELRKELQEKLEDHIYDEFFGRGRPKLMYKD